MRGVRLAVLISFVLCIPSSGSTQSLRGSKASLTRQNVQARRHDYTYLERPSDVRRFVDLGLLVPIRPGPAFDLARVSFAYARPQVKLFLDRLGAQYQAACGEKLVVTSLVRPITRQPRNAADRSVHPTGMAIDLRRSRRTSCRRWLERVLLQLERRRVLEATRERRPPHYHLALFPKPYVRYVVALTGSDAESLLAAANGDAATKGAAPRVAAAADAVVAAAEAGESGDVRVADAAEDGGAADGGGPSAEGTDSTLLYRVKRGDNLWSIARRYGTTVARIKQANDLTSSRLMPRQMLRIPVEG